MKKLLIVVMLLAPMSMLAQKFGYVNSAEIVQLMPEFASAQKKLQDLEKMYTDDFNALRTELEKKGTEFEKLQKDSVPENILKRRYEELLQMGRLPIGVAHRYKVPYVMVYLLWWYQVYHR